MQGTKSQDGSPSIDIPVASAATSGSQSRDVAIDDQHRHTSRKMKKSNQICRFYGTKKGCRAQDQCPYLHVQAVNELATPTASIESEPLATQGHQHTAPSTVKPKSVPQSTSSGTRNRAPVTKPVSSLQQRDPREFQIGQVIRRFAPLRENEGDGTILRLKVQPSDPDFPFELQALECALAVPATYPAVGRPSIRVENKEIPRGFQINVERGFDALCQSAPSKTLLQLLNDLDRHLEEYLTTEKAQTIKIVANRRREEPLQQNKPILTNEPLSAVPSLTDLVVSQASAPSWTTQQKVQAKAKRDAEIRQLEARMSRVSLFSSSKDGVTFNVPLQIPKPSRLPLSLQSLREVTLIVPALYDLESCRIKLKGVSGASAENVELVFEKYASDHRDMTLMAHINYLTQNIHVMAIPVAAEAAPGITKVQIQDTSTLSPVEQSEEHVDALHEEVIDKERPHLRFIAQPPPEWSRKIAADDESDSETTDESDFGDYDSDISEGTKSQVGGAAVSAVVSTVALEKGILLSFPHLELHGIELLEMQDISLIVKCDRCKESLDIKAIKPASSTLTSIRTESCNKCAAMISVSYRQEPMHVNSIRAGYLDLEGCTIVDMLPSHFIPTCAECSTRQPTPGVVSVRGESPVAICRECHGRLNFKIPEVKFLRVSSNDPRLNLPLRSKQKKENLGITAGSELPERGRCKHYSKSYRWFRFSCCNRVYPCDRCHDEKEEHPNEHANRMICGWCSREQNYRPEDCHACGRSVVRKTGGGFWEGGKGTRDKNKMSRKDPRKFKRIGGGGKAGEK